MLWISTQTILRCAFLSECYMVSPYVRKRNLICAHEKHMTKYFTVKALLNENNGRRWRNGQLHFLLFGVDVAFVFFSSMYIYNRTEPEFWFWGLNFIKVFSITFSGGWFQPFPPPQEKY